jgi:oxygen-independent coproporphyrinogen-3 oxidase
MKKLGIYLHIPFCGSKCHYCDFCSFPNQAEQVKRAYCAALCAQIDRYAPLCADYEVDTVYFGGGTPTALPSDLLCGLLRHVKERFCVSESAEVTAECNPATASAADFAAMRQAGFNRLSIGAQSMHDGELRLLGRAHTVADFCTTVALARAAGFENISADLMYGIPDQTRESLAESVRALCELGVEHISAYGLKIEEGTPFYQKKDTLNLPDDDEVACMYEDTVAALAAHGLLRYEISNFARTGYESRHNLKYWECDEYLGFGVAAYSCFGGRRFGISRDFSAYLDTREVLEEDEVIRPAEQMTEYVMLGLRLEKGIDKAAFARRFGVEFDAIYQERLRPYIKGGFVADDTLRCRFTTQGFLVSNAILSDVLEFD